MANDPTWERAKEVVAELDRARKKHPVAFNSAHEGYAILLEELEEAWDEIKLREPNMEKMRAEMVQVGAMALRFIEDVCDKKNIEARYPREESDLVS